MFVCSVNLVSDAILLKTITARNADKLRKSERSHVISANDRWGIDISVPCKLIRVPHVIGSRTPWLVMTGP